jgi:NifU-like protein involved in Fe-S cluster formation
MAPGMNAPLYTIDVLRLAASLSDPSPLDHEDGSSDVRSPTCGSRIRMAVQLDEERRVERISMAVHACAFGQASAALVEKHSPGRSHDDIAAAMLALSTWLSGEGVETAAWPVVEALQPARSRKSRHAAILLPFRALLAAIEAAH